MKKVKEFISRPRNVYFSIILMLTLISGLASISFSYYIDDSNMFTQKFSVDVVDNRLQSEYIEDGKLHLEPSETLTFDVNIISNNDFDSIYKYYYITDNNIDIAIVKDDFKIGAKDIKKVSIEVTNNDLEEASVTIGIVSGYPDKKINLNEREIELKNDALE